MAERDIWGSIQASMGVKEKDVDTVFAAVANAVALANEYREPIAAQARSASAAIGREEPSLAGSVASMDNSWVVPVPNPATGEPGPAVQAETESIQDEGPACPEI